MVPPSSLKRFGKGCFRPLQSLLPSLLEGFRFPFLTKGLEGFPQSLDYMNPFFDVATIPSGRTVLRLFELRVPPSPPSLPLADPISGPKCEERTLMSREFFLFRFPLSVFPLVSHQRVGQIRYTPNNSTLPFPGDSYLHLFFSLPESTPPLVRFLEIPPSPPFFKRIIWSFFVPGPCSPAPLPRASYASSFRPT